MIKQSLLQIAILASLFLTFPAQPSVWNTCRLKVQVLEVVKKPRLSLRATIVSVIPLTSQAECPKTGYILNFEPESFDYQTMLPKNKWPRTGSNLKMRYMYLDGFCKNDGNTQPCRIKHYPVGW